MPVVIPSCVARSPRLCIAMIDFPTLSRLNSRASRDAWINSEAFLNRSRQAAPLLDGEIQITLYEEP